MLESAAVRALLLSLAAGLSTLLGALVVFAARRRSEKLLAVSLGFAGGVMLAVSFTDLFPTAREHLTASPGGRPGALAAVPIWFYNGKRGKQQAKFLFYWFYPLHLFVLFLIRWYFLGIPLA